jgi:hypothetical protein
MRMRFLAGFLLVSPLAFGQASMPSVQPPGAPLPAHSGTLIVVVPQARDFSVPPNGGWSAQQLPGNQPFRFAVPTAQPPTAKIEPIPTQWPGVQFEAIPTRWPNLQVVPIDGTAATAVPGSTTLFVQPGRK